MAIQAMSEIWHEVCHELSAEGQEERARAIQEKERRAASRERSYRPDPQEEERPEEMKQYLADQPVDLEDLYVKPSFAEVVQQWFDDQTKGDLYVADRAGIAPISAPAKEPPIFVKELKLTKMESALDAHTHKNVVRLELWPKEGIQPMIIECTPEVAAQLRFGRMFTLTINPLGDAND
jgi:hypothetical protein